MVGRPASTDASPSISHAQAAAYSAEAVHMMDSAAALLNAAAPAIQQPAQLQHSEPEMLDTGKTQAAASAISHDAHPDHQISNQLDSSGKGQPQQQLVSVSMSGVAHHTGTDAADATEDGMQFQQEAAGAAKGATVSQKSSSMMSLPPSLKLDIPGLDDMLDSHMLSEHEDEAMSQPLVQPSLQQQQHTADQQHQHQQQPVEEHQQQQQQGDSPFIKDMPALDAEAQAASMLSAGPSSSPAHQCSLRSVPSAGLPHSEHQAAEEAVSCSLIDAVPQQHTLPQQHAKPSLDKSGIQTVQAASALLLSAAAAADTSGHDVPTANQGQQLSNTGCASELAVDDRSPAGPADGLLSQKYQVGSSNTSEALQPLHDILQRKPGSSPSRETRPSAISSPKSAETVAPDSALTDSMPEANRSSDAMPEASIHAKEPCDKGSAAQGTAMQQAHGAVPAPSQTVDAAAVEQLPDAATVPMRQDEAVGVSQQDAEPLEDVALGQEGLHTSQHTSVTASKQVCYLLDS